MNWLIDPLAQYPFMRTGMLAAVLVGTTCAILGSYVVLRRMAFIGDAIAHTTVPGVAIAYLSRLNLFAGALVAGLLTTMGIGLLSGRDTVREDTAIGVVYTAMFALGAMIIIKYKGFRDFSSLLVGHVTTVTRTDLIFIAIIAFVILATLALFHKELELTSVDPTYSAVIGLRANWMRNILLVLLAFAIVTSIQVVGVIMTSALLVTPAAAASLLTRNLIRMMSLAAAIAISSGIIGLYASFYLDVAAGPAIVITCTAWFAAAFFGRHLLRRQPRV